MAVRVPQARQPESQTNEGKEDAQKPCVRDCQALSPVPWWLAQRGVLELVCGHERDEAGLQGRHSERALPAGKQIPVAVIGFTGPEFAVAARCGVAGLAGFSCHFSVQDGLQTASAKTGHGLWCIVCLSRCLEPLKHRQAQQQQAQHNPDAPVGLGAVRCGGDEGCREWHRVNASLIGTEKKPFFRSICEAVGCRFKR